ncbi:MAG: OmpA family protein [Calditrichaeota bacterium]|nr:MAG: OmpA family protein [Calditrichota bacterium]
MKKYEEENAFALSIGDLMAALLLIFVLLLSSTLLRLEKETEEKVNIAEKYVEIKRELYNNLFLEFKEDLPKWGAEIDSLTLSFMFHTPDILFKQGDYKLSNKFQEILTDFFPRYINVLSEQKFRDAIEEIRIEGHTSSEWSFQVEEDKAYFYNMELSQNRTRAVLEFSLLQIDEKDLKDWCRGKITANGLSSSKLVFENGIENKAVSRRVEFRVRTDAEKRIDELLKLSLKNND